MQNLDKEFKTVFKINKINYLIPIMATLNVQINVNQY